MGRRLLQSLPAPARGVMPLVRVRRTLLSLLTLTALRAAPAFAQKPGWSATVDVNASTLFGASSQTLASFAAAAKHAGTAFSGDASVRFRYGESEDAEGVKFVSARGWALAASVDGVPEGRVSPFVLVAAEQSLEKRLARRTAGGAGIKWVLSKSEAGVSSLSGAVLGERTLPLSDSLVDATNLVRWSWRLKAEHQIERLKLSHVTYYGPELRAPSQYTITTTSMASFAINSAIALTTTVTDNYDNQARVRGARSNSDGSFLFGIRATF
ncbi:MAG: DUF481 domain-containing protein [bacterium]